MNVLIRAITNLKVQYNYRNAPAISLAINGDTKAAKLYFSVMGDLNNDHPLNNTLIQNQNNYIQINGTVLSQEAIKQLNPEQLNTIESILKEALPKPEVLEVNKE